MTGLLGASGTCLATTEAERRPNPRCLVTCEQWKPYIARVSTVFYFCIFCDDMNTMLQYCFTFCHIFFTIRLYISIIFGRKIGEIRRRRGYEKVKAKDRSRTKNKVSSKAETASYKGNKTQKLQTKLIAAFFIPIGLFICTGMLTYFVTSSTLLKTYESQP